MLTLTDITFLVLVVLLKYQVTSGQELSQNSSEPNLSVRPPLSKPLSLYVFGRYSVATVYDALHYYIWSKAIQDLNNDPSTQPLFANASYKFIHSFVSSVDAEESKGISAIQEAIRNKAVAIIGPENSCFTEARIATAFNLLMLSPTCSDPRPTTASPNAFRTLVRVQPSYSDYAESIVAMFKKHQWQTVALIAPPIGSFVADGSTLYTTIVNGLRQANIEVLEQQFTWFWTGRRQNISNCPTCLNDMHKAIAVTYLKTRVYMFFPLYYVEVQLFQQFLTRMGLMETGEYFLLTVYQTFTISQFFLMPSTLSLMVYDEYQYNISVFRNTSNLSKMMQWNRNTAALVRTQVNLSSPKIAEIQTYINTLIDTWNWTCPPMCPTTTLKKPPGYTYQVAQVDVQIYDTIMMYARTLVNLYNSGQNITDGKLLSKTIRNRTYTSVAGYDFFIDENGQARGNMTVVYPMTSPMANGTGLYPIGNFWQNSVSRSDLSFQFVSPSIQFKWVSGQAPISQPKCGFDGSRCVYVQNDSWKWIIAGMVAMVVFWSAVIIFVYRHFSYEKDLQSLLWKIDSKDLIIQTQLTQALGSAWKSHASFTGGEMGSIKALESTLALKEVEQNLAEIINKNSQTEKGKAAFATTGNASKHPCAKISSFGQALYKGQMVALKRIYKSDIVLSRAVRKELKRMRDFNAENLVKFYGAIHEPPHVILVLENCYRGSLKILLTDQALQMDEAFRASIVFDIIKGLQFLHHSEFLCHGRLKSSNCMVDDRWRVLLSGYGLAEFRNSEGTSHLSEEDRCKDLIWTAPELLRDPSMTPNEKCDVYSFGIILHEIFGRSGPYGGDLFLDAIEIIQNVKMPPKSIEAAFRPELKFVEEAPHYVQQSMVKCWNENPMDRPKLSGLSTMLHPLKKGMKSNMMDNMVTMLEKYTNNMEGLVEEKTMELEDEMKKTERLLLQLLPRAVCEQLKLGLPVEPESYDCVSIYFSDIAGFTKMSSESTPMQVVSFLNDLYTCFDTIIGNLDVYKVETIGDAYMVTSGLPIKNGDNHAGEIASMSLQLLQQVKNFKIRHRPDETLKLRIGIHSGPVMAGVVGLKMPRYCLFGPTVLVASGMEQTGEPLKIHCSYQCKELLDSLGGYQLMERGIIPVKGGKGEHVTYWVLGEDVGYRKERIDREIPKYHSLKRVLF